MSKSRILSFYNLDAKLMQMERPIIVNSKPMETEEDRKALEDLLLTRYKDSDVLDTIPRCGCGKYNQAKDLDMVCDKCGTVVVSHHSQSMDSDLWVTTPHGIDHFLAPLPWMFLERVLKSKTFSGLTWALDPTMTFPESNNRKAKDIVNRFLKLGYQRGLRNLKSEFPKLLEVALKSVPDIHDRAELKAFFDFYGDTVFVKNLPIPTKAAFAIEGTVYANYYDETIAPMVDAVMASADTASERDVRKLEARFTKIQSNMAQYFTDVIQTRFSTKSGWFRRVLAGTRMFFSYRGIATSMHDWHAYDETSIPYNQLVVMLESFLKARLIKEHNWSKKQAEDYIFRHTNDYDPLLWSMLEDYIDETPPAPPSPADTIVKFVDGKIQLVKRPSTLTTREIKGGGIWSPITRYPSLRRGSTTAKRITGISHNAITMSILALRALNLDFD